MGMDLELKGKIEVTRSTRKDSFLKIIDLAASFITQSPFKSHITFLTGSTWKENSTIN